MLNRISSFISLLFILILSVTSSFADSPSARYEVIVFHNKYCSHCKSWMSSTGSSYDKDAPQKLGQHAPKLVKYDLSERSSLQIYQEMLSSGKLSSPIDGVPAFVIVDENQIEVKRTIGAMGKDEFYKFVSDTVLPAGQY